MTRHWATYADSNYLGRLKALYASMQRHCGDFVLHVLAWDGGVEQWAYGQDMKARNVPCAFIDNLIFTHPQLALEQLPGPTRTRVEHMWTVGPQWIADVMRSTGQPVTYVDADCYAFSSPEPFFAEAGDAPAAFCGHNFASASAALPGPTWESHAGLFGAVNCGLLHFREVRVAQMWADLCREWCYDRPDGVIELAGTGRLVSHRYADQKYLEDIVRKWDAIVIGNKAAMVGPWNIHSEQLESIDGTPWFAGSPIGFYHFSGLRIGPHGQWSPSRPEYQINEAQVDAVYVPYLREVDGK